LKTVFKFSKGPTRSPAAEEARGLIPPGSGSASWPRIFRGFGPPVQPCAPPAPRLAVERDFGPAGGREAGTPGSGEDDGVPHGV